MPQSRNGSHVLYVRLIGFLLFFTSVVKGQDIHLSQYFNAPLLRNPALAGIFEGDVRVQAVYRNQWSSVAYPYQTHALNAEYKFAVGQGNDFMTVGASFFYDRAGVQNLKTMQVMPVLNFHKSLSGNKSTYLSGGFMAGFVSRQFNGQQLTFDNQYNGHYYDPSLASGEQFIGINKSFFDVAVGLSFNSQITENNTYYAGVSLWHFNKPVTGFLSDQISLDPKWQFNGGFKQNLNDNLDLTLEGNHLIQGLYSQTMLSAILRLDLTGNLTEPEASINHLSIGGGLMMRLNDAVIPYVQVSYNHFDIGISYDINTSPLKTASQGMGGFEFSVSYRAFTGQQNSSVQSVLCPRF